MMTAMTVMNNYHAFRACAAPPALAAIPVTQLDANTRAHFPTFAAHFAAVSVTTLAANFHPSTVAVALFSHFAAFLRPAFVSLNLAGLRCTLIDRDPGLGSVFRKGRSYNCDSCSGSQQIADFGHFEFLKLFRTRHQRGKSSGVPNHAKENSELMFRIALESATTHAIPARCW
jgi:hypothetical protein